jgi:phage minor structural protein
MITIYNPDAQDWSNNGLGVLTPTSCTVKEVGGGEYELEIVHPLDENLRWQMLQRGFLIKAPVPERETPFIQQSAEARAESPEHIIWHVTAATAGVYTKASSGYSTWSSGATYSKGAKRNYNGRSYRWSSETPGNATPPAAPWVKITTGSKKIKTLKQGTEIIYHEDSDTYSKITTPDGTTGYILKSSIAYKRTEPFVSAQPAYQTAVPARQIRDQVFRIYDVQIVNKDQVLAVTASARHIHYDQLGNVIKTYSPTGADPQAALIAMSGDCLNEHDFNYYTNCTDAITAEWARKNVIEAIHDPDNGIVPKLHAQLVRDNYDTFILQNVERDRGVTIAYGKNMLGISSKANDEAAITRIMPIGYDENGAPMLLPELCIDSQFIGDYPTERAVPLDVQEAKVHAANGDDPGMTAEQAFAKMREEAQKQFDAGCDLVDLEITVDFIHLGDTVEYASLKNLQQVFMYDTVTIRHSKLGLLYKTQVIGYEFDAILGRYNKVTLGNIKNGAELGAVAGFQLPSMGISGNKLVPGTVGSTQLQALSVLNAHIANLSVNAAKIQDLAVETAKIKDLAVETAKIKDAAITNAKIALLAVETANIKDLNVTAAKIADATITAAKILDATITRAKIQAAAIGTAEIDNLAVTTAKIALGAITTALINTGAIGTAQIADASITDGKIVALTANKINAGTLSVERLIIVGSNQSIVFAINNANGTAQLSQTTIDGGALTQRSITADRIVAGAITANEIAAATIVANNIAANAITAAKIASDAIEARHIKAGEITTGHISAPAQAALRLEASNYIQQGTNLLARTKGPFTALSTDYLFKSYVVTDIMAPGVEYTLTVKAENINSNQLAVGVVFDGDWVTAPKVTITTWDGIGHITFTAPSFTAASVECYNAPSGNGNPLILSWLVLAKGNKSVADWQPSPDDVSGGAKTSHFTMTDDSLTGSTGGKVLFEGAEISFAAALYALYNADKTKLIQEITESYSRSYSDIFTAIHIISDVVNTFPGGTIPWPGDPQSAFNNVGKWLMADAYLTIPAGTYTTGLISIKNTCGAKLFLTLAPGVHIIGRLYLFGCTFVQITVADPNSTSIVADQAGDYVVFVDACKFVRMDKLNVSGYPGRTNASNGTLFGVQVDEGSTVYMHTCQIERTNMFAVLASSASNLIAYDCRGGIAGGSSTDFSTVHNMGRGIYSQLGSNASATNFPASVNGNGYGDAGTLNVTGSAQSSTGAAPAAPSVMTYAVSAGYEKKTESDGSSSFTWNAGEPRQGSWSEWAFTTTPIGKAYSYLDYNGFGLFLLTNAANIVSDRPAGKTIASGTMKIRRDASAGTSGTVSCTLWQHGLSTIANGAPNTQLFAQAANAVTISPNQEVTITLNASAIAGLNSGACKGFGFKNTGGYGRYDIYGELTVTYS